VECPFFRNRTRCLVGGWVGPAISRQRPQPPLRLAASDVTGYLDLPETATYHKHHLRAVRPTTKTEE